MELRTDPVFIVGYGRSGTTLLRFMLNAHPDIAIPPEFRHFPLHDRHLLMKTIRGSTCAAGVMGRSDFSASTLKKAISKHGDRVLACYGQAWVENRAKNGAIG